MAQTIGNKKMSDEQKNINGNGGDKKSITIIVNAREKEWDKKEISYEEVVVLAFGSYTDNETVAYTVVYSKGENPKHEGSLIKGETVKVKDGMIFNVTQTNKS